MPVGYRLRSGVAINAGAEVGSSCRIRQMYLEVCAPALAGFAVGVDCSVLHLVVCVDLVADPDDQQDVRRYCHQRQWLLLVYAPDVVRPAVAQPVHRLVLLAVDVAGEVAVGSVLCHLTAVSDQ